MNLIKLMYEMIAVNPKINEINLRNLPIEPPKA